MKKLIYTGLLQVGSHGEYDHALFLNDDVLTEHLSDEISGKVVTVRYHISDVPLTKSQLTESLIKKTLRRR